MKSKITIIAALLFVAPLLHAQAELQRIAIRLTRLASDGQKEVVAPELVVADGHVVRIHVDDASPLDISIGPKLDGERVTLTLQVFAKDGAKDVRTFPVLTTRLGDPIEVRVGALAYRILAILDGARPTKKA